MQYLVTWTIDLEADNPMDAAQEALNIQRDWEATATLFEVQEWDPDSNSLGPKITVDPTIF